MAPAQISGAALNESRITAAEVASAETDRLGSHGPAVIISLPRHSVSTLALAGSSTLIAESASTISAKRIFESRVQVSQHGEALRSGVKLTGLPPVEAIQKMSPAGIGSSLIRPSTKAM